MSVNYLSKACGLLYGLDIHHLDHLAPLCCALNIPLVFTDLDIKSVCDQTYPGIQTEHTPLDSLAEHLTAKREVVFSCLPHQLLAPIFSFAEHKQRKKILFAWLPHGNSDKDSLGALVEESYLLVYGKQMRDTMTRKNVFESVHHSTTVGNFRKLYYLKHKKELDDLVAKQISFKSKNHKTILYAPTWGTPGLAESSHLLLSTLPDEYNLMVKFHPNTLSTGFARACKEAFGDAPNIEFIEEIPTVYPILNQCDVYVGDHSSIAYDFLSLNRPLYFFTDEQTPIHHTGKIVSPSQVYNEIKSGDDPYAEARKTLYDYAFEPTPTLDKLKPEIEKSLDHYFDTEPHVPE